MVTLAGWDALCQHSIVDFLVVLAHSSTLPKEKDKKRPVGNIDMYTENLRWTEQNRLWALLGPQKLETAGMTPGKGEGEISSATPSGCLWGRKRWQQHALSEENWWGREIDERRCASYLFAYNRSFNLQHPHTVCIVYSIQGDNLRKTCSSMLIMPLV